MSMGMAELLTKIGDDKIEFQVLGNDYFQATENARDCKISFATTKGTALQMERQEVIGMVIRLKREDVDAATGKGGVL